MLSEEIKTQKRREVIQSETLFLFQLPILNQYRSIFLYQLRLLFQLAAHEYEQSQTIAEWLRLKRTLKSSSFKPPAMLSVGPRPLFPYFLHRDGNGQILRATACQREAGQSHKEYLKQSSASKSAPGIVQVCDHACRCVSIKDHSLKTYEV